MKKSSPAFTDRSWKVLIVEDDRSMRKGLVLELIDRGFQVEEADSFESGSKALENIDFDLMITDLRLPEKDDGIRLVEQLKQRSPRTPAMVITAFGSIDAAVKAMQAGAEDFVTKGFTIDELVIKIEKIFDQSALLEEKERLSSENVSLKTEIERLLPQWELVGSGKSSIELEKSIREYARTNFTILIQGETGTGKELVSRAIHRAGSRRLKPFVVINCSTIPRDLLESELFGHEKGSFTSANSRKTGQFEAAHGGILFLDEIGDLDYGLQSKVLRAIEYKEFTRIGGTKPINIDVQIIAATNRNIFDEVEKQTFREDLYYRLNVLVINVPPLRDRREDIPELAHHFLRLFAEETGNGPFTLEPAALEVLMDYDWPGNIRELKNAIFRAASMAVNQTITVKSLGLSHSDPAIPEFVNQLIETTVEKGEENLDPASFKYAQDLLEEKFARDALVKAHGKIRLAARLLGVSRNTFKKMMLKDQLSDQDFD